MNVVAEGQGVDADEPAAPRSRERVIVHRDPFAYCSHPSILALANGEWLIAFMESMRRGEVLHSPSDPRFYNVLTRSSDLGRSWSAPAVIPGYDWYGVECPSLTRLASGDLLLFQWRWRWAPWPSGAGERAPGRYERGGYPWARGNDGAFVHRSRDGGLTWELSERIDTDPFPGAYTMRAAVELADGTLLLAVTDIPEWSRIYLLQSSDGGESWAVGALVAEEADLQFSEPCIAQAGSRLVILIREERTGFIHQSDSWDDGRSWTSPRPTPMWGCPPHLLALGDGRLLCTYGYRRAPFGVRACLSHDGGETWEIGNEIVLRDDLGNANLGYPSSVMAGPGKVFTTYYAEDEEAVTGIEGMFWEIQATETRRPQAGRP